MKNHFRAKAQRKNGSSDFRVGIQSVFKDYYAALSDLRRPASPLSCMPEERWRQRRAPVDHLIIRNARSSSVHFRNSGFALRQSEMFNPRTRSHDGNVRKGRRSRALTEYYPHKTRKIRKNKLHNGISRKNGLKNINLLSVFTSKSIDHSQASVVVLLCVLGGFARDSRSQWLSTFLRMNLSFAPSMRISESRPAFLMNLFFPPCSRSPDP